MTPSTTVSQYLIRRLLEYGVEHVFGVPGDYFLNFCHQLEESPLQFINTSDEQGAGFAADAYARLRGMGVVCVTYCVGGLKLANTTAQAYAEKSPVVVISGAPGLNERLRDPLLHHKVRDFATQLRIFRELTAAATDLTDVDNGCCEIDRVLETAWRCKRPVYIELPRDLTECACQAPCRPRPQPAASDGAQLTEALDEIRSRLSQARRPVILAGIEVQRYGLQGALLDLLKRTGLPFATTLLAKSVLPEDHPQFIGLYEGALGADRVRQQIEDSDCLLLLGAFLTDINLGIFTARLNPACTIYATSERTTVGHHAYPEVYLPDLLDSLREGKLTVPPGPAATQRPPAAPWTASEKSITIARLMVCLESFLAADSVLLADPGEALFAAADLTIRHPGAFLAPAYYTSMGFAVPGAIGAQLARPDLRPVVLVGDGAFQMTGMELATAARFGLNPIVIVLNNGGYSTERPMLDGAFNDIPAWRFSRLPEFLGSGRSYDIHTERQLEAALQQAMEDKSTWALLEIHLHPDDRSPALQRLTEALAKRVRVREQA
jgi:TPP-dependent 2-oxoacid decarboxylase